LVENQGSKGKEEYLSTSKVNCGGLSNLLKFKGIQASDKKRRIQGEGIPRIAWELEF